MMQARRTWSHDSGAALLTTLVLVAGLSAISVAVLADMRRDQRLSANAQSTAQAQWFAIGAEAFARVTVEELVNGTLPRTALAGPPRTATFPLDHGVMHVSVRDASTCINANSVVSGAGDIFERDEAGISQVTALMEMQGLSAGQAAELTDALTAWMDTGGGSVGTDDAPYSAMSPPYLTGGEPLSEFSELRAIRGFTPEVTDKLKPWLCVLPSTGPSRVNLNALALEQAPVLVAVSGGHMTQSQARAVIQRRPLTGWQSVGEVFSDPALASLDLDERALAALTLDTRFIALDVVATHGDAEAAMSELMVRGGQGFVAATRRWTEES